MAGVFCCCLLLWWLWFYLWGLRVCCGCHRIVFCCSCQLVLNSLLLQLPASVVAVVLWLLIVVFFPLAAPIVHLHVAIGRAMT